MVRWPPNSGWVAAGRGDFVAGGDNAARLTMASENSAVLTTSKLRTALLRTRHLPPPQHPQGRGSRRLYVGDGALIPPRWTRYKLAAVARRRLRQGIDRRGFLSSCVGARPG